MKDRVLKALFLRLWTAPTPTSPGFEFSFFFTRPFYTSVYHHPSIAPADRSAPGDARGDAKAWRWHVCAGLYGVPFLFMLAITGFQTRLGVVVNVTPQAQPTSVVQQAGAALAHWPGAPLKAYIAPKGAHCLSRTPPVLRSTRPDSTKCLGIWSKRPCPRRAPTPDHPVSAGYAGDAGRGVGVSTGGRGSAELSVAGCAAVVACGGPAPHLELSEGSVAQPAARAVRLRAAGSLRSNVTTWSTSARMPIHSPTAWLWCEGT